MKRLLTAVVTGLALAAPGAAHAAGIHPGVQTVTQGAQCTANFIFTDGGATYVGQAAHCASTGAATVTNGCQADSLPLGTAVQVEGATRPGTLVYSSWLTMQSRGERDGETCAYNDFALVRLDPADAGRVDPSVPGWGGPAGVGSLGGTGASAYTYGNSSLRAGVAALSPKQGVVVQRSPGGWSSTVYTVTPGIPGDSGSGFLNGSGQAAGTLSTLAVAPLPGSNGVGDLPRELSYMRANGGPAAVLVDGDDPFQTSLAAAIASAMGLA